IFVLKCPFPPFLFPHRPRPTSSPLTQTPNPHRTLTLTPSSVPSLSVSSVDRPGRLLKLPVFSCFLSGGGGSFGRLTRSSSFSPPVSPRNSRLSCSIHAAVEVCAVKLVV
ncbi:hypothetical protein AKJ16_DCAP18803, partial [Drosera capensis]